MNKQVDYKLFFSVFILIIFWMIMISSVSVYSSFRVTSLMEKAWTIESAYNYFYVIRNIIHVFIALLVLLFFVKIPYKFFEKYSKHFLYTSIFLLILVLVIWSNWNWARWWINLHFLPFAIQPTEFLKFSLIIFLASYFKKYSWSLHTLEKWFIPFIFLMSILLVIIWLQPDFWTIMVILPVSTIMFFIAWANVRYLFIFFILLVFFVFWIYSLWKYDKSLPETRNKLSYITDRIDNFLDDEKEAIKSKTINYQTEQALIAIWSWGFSWLWFWNSIQKFWYLPEVQWDFIFSVIVEELWFIWALVLLSIYSYIWYRWFYIAYYSQNLFARFSAIGISSWILIQAFINIWVNLNLLPLTWITLPFVSYWWSSLIALILWVWLLLNISRDIDFSNWWRFYKSKKMNFKKQRVNLY